MKRILIVSILCAVAYLVGHPSVITNASNAWEARKQEQSAIEQMQYQLDENKNRMSVLLGEIARLNEEKGRTIRELIKTQTELRELHRNIDSKKLTETEMPKDKDDRALKSTLEDSK